MVFTFGKIMKKEIRAFRNLRAFTFLLLFLTGVITLSTALICTAPNSYPVYKNEINAKENIGWVDLSHEHDLVIYIMLLPLYGIQIWALLHFGKRMKKVEELCDANKQAEAEPNASGQRR